MALYLKRVTKIQSNKAFSKEAYGSKWSYTSTQVRDQSNWHCSNCGKNFTFNKYALHTHHIIPISKGGSNQLGNLTALCVECHKEEHKH